MKAFFSMFKWQEFKEKLSEVIRRFPVPFVLSFAVTLLFFLLIWGDFSSETETCIWKWIMTGVVTFFLATGLTLFGEASEKYKKLSPLSGILSLAFGWMFYIFLSSDFESIETVVFFILTLFGIISFLFIAPYIKHLKTLSHKPESYYVYFYRISVVFFISLIVGGALALLGNIAIATVQTLFDIAYAVMDDLYGYWTSLALALLTPIFALTQLPKKDEFEESYFNENAFFNFLVRYIAIPFIYVYFFILYAYSAKVLMNFSDWPKGEVSWMVIGFSLFGYATYMFSYIFECGKKTERHKLIVLFRKYFPLVVIPQTAMLFYAIGLRIGQYDLTMNRYFVVVFGIWLLIVSLYLVVSKKKALIYIPSLLTLFTIIISIGPWSVYHLPLTRQLDRLERNLIEANILQDGKIVPLEKHTDISKDLSNQIYDGIEYVCDFNSCDEIKELFPEIYKNAYEKDKKEYEEYKIKYPDDQWRQREYTGPSSWEIVRAITDEIKVQRHYSWDNFSSKSYTIYSSGNIYPLDIDGYSTLLEVSTSSFERDEDTKEWFLSVKNETLEITRDTTNEIIDISHVFSALREAGSLSTSTNLTQAERSFEIRWEIFTAKLIIDSATIPEIAGDTDTDRYYYMHGFLLLK